MGFTVTLTYICMPCFDLSYSLPVLSFPLLPPPDPLFLPQ